MTDPESIAAAATQVSDTFGRLDVLVNNAGISGTAEPAVAMSSAGAGAFAQVREVFATNVLGVIGVTEGMAGLLRLSTAGRIVNVSSGVGSMARMSDPADYFSRLPPLVAYAASKSAVNSLTVQYAKAFRADGIHVNAADPGPCATDFTKGMPGLTRTAPDGATVIVRLATLDADGPTGGYFNESGPVPW